MQLLLCRLAPSALEPGRVALPAREVQRILFVAPLQDPQPPPSLWAGDLDLGGRPTPVYRLAALLGWPAPSETDDLHSHLVLCGETLLGVHRAESLEPASPAQLRPGAELPPGCRGLAAGGWLRGDELVPLLVPALLRRRIDQTGARS